MVNIVQLYDALRSVDGYWVLCVMQFKYLVNCVQWMVSELQYLDHPLNVIDHILTVLII